MPPLPIRSLCLLQLMKPKLDAAFPSAALHASTRSAAAHSDAHARLVATCREICRSNPMHMARAYYLQLQLPAPGMLQRAKRHASSSLESLSSSLEEPSTKLRRLRSTAEARYESAPSARELRAAPARDGRAHDGRATRIGRHVRLPGGEACTHLTQPTTP